MLKFGEIYTEKHFHISKESIDKNDANNEHTNIKQILHRKKMF